MTALARVLETRPARHVAAALALAGLIVAALPVAEGVRWSVLGLAALGLASLWLGAVASGGSRRDDPASPDGDGHATGDEPELRTLLVNVLPVWLQHVSSVKNQTEEAINNLAVSFSSINQQFEAAGFGPSTAAAGGPDPAQFSLLKLCERELQPVIATIMRIIESKKQLMNTVNDLAGATRDLVGMVTEVKLIAAHTNLLAINAAIEAAHAGDSGRGFAVIAKEIRSLSQNSAAAGTRISQRMDHVQKMMTSTIEQAELASASDREAIELSGRVIEDVLEHVRDLGNEAEAMREKGNVIRADTENLLVNLQFQDRVSQIISVIDGDIGRLQETVAADEVELPSAEQWLAELSSRYTMHDQRVGAAATATAAAPSDDVVFF